MAKKFLNLSRKECLNCYQELINNSDRHFKAGEILSDKKEYGIAISHLILGTEELTKGLIIYLDGEGLQIRKVKGVIKFFSNHEIRHLFAGFFMLMNSIVKPFMKSVKTLHQLIHNPEAITGEHEFESAILSKNKTKVEQIAKEWGERIGKKMDIHYSFWEKAEINKQRGFYVDYDEKLLSPNELNEKDYLFAEEVTKYFKQECIDIIEYVRALKEIEKEIFVNIINSKKDIYKTLQDFISNQEKNRK